MAALALEKAGSVRVICRDKRPIAANVKAIKGGLAMAITTGVNRGFVQPAAAGVQGVIVGRFTETVDNTGGANGAKSVEIQFQFGRERLIFLCVNDVGTALTAADRESVCYVLDDQTVTGDATKIAIAGTVYDVTAEGVWVEVPLGALTPAPRIQYGQVTLVAGTKTVNAGISLSATSAVIITRRTQGGTVSTTVTYEELNASRVNGGPGVATLVFQASVAAGTIQNADTSTLDYVIVG